MKSKSEIREEVWKKLRAVAFPDPIFDFDFSSFIADFQGSEKCAETIANLDSWKKSGLVFITPDNSLIKLREKAILTGKRFVMTTYGIKRGFLLIDPNTISMQQAAFASTLYGAELFGKKISLEELRALGRLDLVITGAAAVTMCGVRFGKGHGYFDIEWGIFTSLNLVDMSSKIIVVVHDCQVTDEDFKPSSFDTVTDYIVTPTQIFTLEPKYRKPTGIDSNLLTKELLDTIPPLQELERIQNQNG
ncbi:MAG: 5-formyltetrahydrofolate cyclo-ligase [Candidatus Bathyarchaeia archaeon]